MTSVGVAVIPAAGVEWDRVLDVTRCDYFHRKGYNLLAEHEVGGQAFLAVARNGSAVLAWPYVVRQVPGTSLVDGTSASGFVGPVAGGLRHLSAHGRSEFLARAWDGMVGAWTDQGLVSMFTTFHPLLGNTRLAVNFRADPCGPLPLVQVGRTVAVDLSLSRGERWAAYAPETRQKIRRAVRAGLAVRLDDSFERLDRFTDLYRETMHRNGANARYLCSRDYFAQFVDLLAPAVHLVTAEDGEEVVGGCMLVVAGDLAYAHYLGVATAHLRFSPFRLMVDVMADLSKALGARLLHLGAGRGGCEDSLFDVKRRLGSVLRPFHVGRWVLDGPRYRTLLEDRGVPLVDDLQFFPAYRA